ncbi:MAG: hypothetical protein HC894_11400 [Microcoleus sp. SM1_3_4]|nr:hypothetical protein [Microcoleus sp. SM1_3_4]
MKLLLFLSQIRWHRGPGATTAIATATTTITNDDVAPVSPPIAENNNPPAPIVNAGIIVNPTSGLVTTETGGTDKFTIKLNSQPTADVTINLRSNNEAEGIVSPTSVTFNSSNWNLEQTVTVTGAPDRVFDGSQIYSIVTDPAVSADRNYSGLNAIDVLVTNSDNDPNNNNKSIVDPVTGDRYKAGELLVKLKPTPPELQFRAIYLQVSARSKLKISYLPSPSNTVNPPSPIDFAFITEGDAIALPNPATSAPQTNSNSTAEQLPQWREVKFAANADLQQNKSEISQRSESCSSRTQL